MSGKEEQQETPGQTPPTQPPKGNCPYCKEPAYTVKCAMFKLTEDGPSCMDVLGCDACCPSIEAALAKKYPKTDASKSSSSSSSSENVV